MKLFIGIFGVLALVIGFGAFSRYYAEHSSELENMSSTGKRADKIKTAFSLVITLLLYSPGILLLTVFIWLIIIALQALL